MIQLDLTDVSSSALIGPYRLFQPVTTCFYQMLYLDKVRNMEDTIVWYICLRWAQRLFKPG